jgi:hypothetical protein
MVRRYSHDVGINCAQLPGSVAAIQVYINVFRDGKPPDAEPLVRQLPAD